MNKFAIAILLSAGTLISVHAHASPAPVIGAVEGALVGSYFGGAHGAVAGAIVGAVIGTAVEDNYYRGGPPIQGRAYAPRAYYAPPVAYQPYYEPRYEVQYAPSRIVYVQPPVYERYPVVYAGYRAPVYVERYASPRRIHHAPRHEYYDQRHRY
jgi:hypothetical protein